MQRAIDEQLAVSKKRSSLRHILVQGCDNRRLLEFASMKDYQDDLALVKRALSGDERAADTIYAMRSQLLHYLTSKGAPEGSISEDIVVDFLGDCFGARDLSTRASAVRLLETYKGNGPLIGWLKACCWRKFLDHARRFKATPLSDQEELDSGAVAGPAEVALEPEAKARVLAALEYAFDEIDSLQLIFLRLVYFEGVSQKDVAAVFDCDGSTISRQLNEGVKALRRSIDLFQRRYADSLNLEWSDILAICQTPPDFLYEN
jgi:DNA-directed RNA polymerase specialized sigma24 family protein